MWTYQEIKLANHAIVLTKQGPVNWNEMVDTLKESAELESGEIQQDHRDKFSSLSKTICRLQRNDKLGVSLPDLAYGCGHRKAGVPLDYARALFPTLGLTWKMSYTAEEAMKQIYLSQKGHATRVALYHGPQRHDWPGWAPATFLKLTHEASAHGFCAVSIIECQDECVWFRWNTPCDLGCEPPFHESSPCPCTLFEDDCVNQVTNPKSIAEFKKAVDEGTAYLLSEEALYPKKPFAFVGLLVERFKEATDTEAWVCMTVAVFDTEPTYSGRTDRWLLLHENPLSDHFMNGKGFSELNYMIEYSERTEGSVEAGETALHLAARSGNEVNFAKLLLEGAIDINARDDRGWTPLHSAASAGESRLIKLLADAGADVNSEHCCNVEPDRTAPPPTGTRGGPIQSRCRRLDCAPICRRGIGHR